MNGSAKPSAALSSRGFLLFHTWESYSFISRITSERRYPLPRGLISIWTVIIFRRNRGCLWIVRCTARANARYYAEKFARENFPGAHSAPSKISWRTSAPARALLSRQEMPSFEYLHLHVVLQFHEFGKFSWIYTYILAWIRRLHEKLQIRKIYRTNRVFKWPDFTQRNP